jgi:hypothetical protein
MITGGGEQLSKHLAQIPESGIYLPSQRTVHNAMLVVRASAAVTPMTSTGRARILRIISPIATTGAPRLLPCFVGHASVAKESR